MKDVRRCRLFARDTGFRVWRRESGFAINMFFLRAEIYQNRRPMVIRNDD